MAFPVSLDNIPSSLSTENVSLVLACYDEATEYESDLPDVDHGVTVEPLHNVNLTSPVDWTSNPQPEGTWSSVVAKALIHLKKLFPMNREMRMRYLSESGLNDEQITALLGLVQNWLSDDELSRLEDLSRAVVTEQKGPRDLFRRWINGSSKIHLTVLLESCSIEDYRLVAAYAVCHALTLAKASYSASSILEIPVPVVGDTP